MGTMLATVSHWLLYSSVGIAVLSFAAIAAVALAVSGLVAIAAGALLVASRALAPARARDEVDGARSHAVHGPR